MKKSREHHWWPVGLQAYWADKNKDVHWITPNEDIIKKRYANRKIAKKSHGHTMFKGNVWETNFETDFNIDSDVRRIISQVQKLKPKGFTVKSAFKLSKLLFKKNRELKDICQYYQISDADQKKLIELILSLSIRSPSNREKWRVFPTHMGFPASDEVAKGNMHSQIRIALELLKSNSTGNKFFIFLRSLKKEFVFSDGVFENIVSSLRGNRISGKALVALTPDICLYITSPMRMRTEINSAALIAPDWMVEAINETTQVYAKEFLFFYGRKPKLSEHYLKNEHRSFKYSQHWVTDELDKIIMGSFTTNSFGPL